MNCSDAKLRMEPYATGNLSSPDREDFEKHIASCAGCSLELDLTRAGVMGGAGGGPLEALDARDGDAGPVPAADEPGSIPFVRSGEPEFHPSGGISASSDLDEVSFADLVSGMDDTTQSAPMPVQSLDDLLATAAPTPEPSMAPAPEPPEAPAAFERSAPAVDPLAALLPGTRPEPPRDVAAPGGQAAPPGAASEMGNPASAPTAPAEQGDWGFEPADSGVRALPPTGSLFLAEETLAQVEGARRKGSPLRSAIWIAGGVLGIVLLGLAGWVIWTARPAAQDPVRLAAERYAASASAAPETSAGPSEAAGEDAAPDAESQPAAAEPPSVKNTGSQATPQEVTPAAPGSAESPREPVLAAGVAPARSPLPRPAPAAQTPRARVARTPDQTRDRAPAHSGTRTPGSTEAVEPPARSAVAPVRSAPSSAASEGATSPTAPTPPDTQTPRSQPPVPAEPGPAEPVPAPNEARATPSVDSEPQAAAARETATPPVTSAPAPDLPTATPDVEPAGESQLPARPIDRIHLATVAAEEREDLAALRDLRSTWKNFLNKSGVGTERIRAKRELADCLWAIQSITARKSDQREALLAYREYILNAPAGGADSRSIARAHLLEDALSGYR